MMTDRLSPLDMHPRLEAHPDADGLLLMEAGGGENAWIYAENPIETNE